MHLEELALSLFTKHAYSIQVCPACSLNVICKVYSAFDVILGLNLINFVRNKLPVGILERS